MISATTDIQAVRPQPVVPQPTLATRVLPLFLLICASSLLAVAMYLEPSPAGFGTHAGKDTDTALPGMSECIAMTRYNVPCATCGMTTSFSLAVRGRLIDSFLNQPAGAMLAVLTAMTVIISLYALYAGLSLVPLFTSMLRPSIMMAIGFIILVAWAYKLLLIRGVL